MAQKKALSEEVAHTMSNITDEELNWADPLPSFQLSLEGNAPRAVTSLSWVMPPYAIAPYTKIRWEDAPQTYSLYVAVLLMQCPHHTDPEGRAWRYYLPTCEPRGLHITLLRKVEINDSMQRGRQLVRLIEEEATASIEMMAWSEYTMDVRSTNNLRVLDIHGGSLRTALLLRQRELAQFTLSTVSAAELECLWSPRLHFAW